MFYGFQLTVPGFLAILITTVPGAKSWDCPSPCKCYNEYVDCSNRDVTHLQENMFNWTGSDQLPELSLENNRLTFLPGHIFDPLLGLRTLNLNHNQLKALEVSLFSKLKNLKFLDMKGNQLSTLPVGMFAFQNELISLDLRNNRLSTLDVKVMTPMLSLNTLLISGNPIHCDCRLQPVVLWSFDVLENTDAKCRSPPQYQDRSWNVTTVDCTPLLSTVIVTPSIDTTPDIETYPSTSVPEVSPINTTQPGNGRRHFNLYSVSTVLVMTLTVVCLVLIVAMVFVSWYKRLKFLSPRF